MAATSPAIPTEALRLWLDAGDGVTQCDGKVSRWADKSGHGLDAFQDQESCRPVLVANALNSQPAIHFDGEDDFLRFSPFDVNGLTAMTLVLMSANWKYATNSEYGDEGGPHGTVSAALLFEEVGAFGAWGVVYLNPFQTVVKARFGTGQADSDDFWQRPESIGDNYAITTAVKSGSTERLWVDGEIVATFTEKYEAIANTGNEGWLGRGRVDSYGPHNIAEVLIYSKALSKKELDQLHAYLHEKYFAEQPTTGV